MYLKFIIFMKMKKIYLLIIFAFVCTDIYSQMQKIYSKYPNEVAGFGGFKANFSGDTIIGYAGKRLYSKSEIGDPANDSLNMSFFVKKGDKWENILYHSFEHMSLKHSNYSEGRLIRKVESYNSCKCDILEIHKLNNNKDFYIADTIQIHNSSGAKIKLYKDWMILAGSKQIGFGQEFRIRIYIYHYKDNNWKRKDLIKIDNENVKSTTSIKEIEINDKYLVISYASAYMNGKGNGKVFVFRMQGNNWEKVQEIVQPDPYWKGSGFGKHLSLSPDNKYLAIGASRDETGLINGCHNRCIYIYENKGGIWELQQKLSKRQCRPTWFGSSFEICNGELLIGNPNKYEVPDIVHYDKGVIEYYKLKNGLWAKIGEIQPPASDIHQGNFGDNIKRKGETVVAGAPADSTYYHDVIYSFVSFSGAAYIFQIPARDTLNIELCEGGSYTFNDTVITTSGHYIDTLMASYGVDSVVQLYVNVHPVPQVEIDTFICPGDSIKIGEEVFTEAGEYEVMLKSSYGCDSIVQLSLGISDIELLDSTIVSDYGCGSGAIDISIVENNPPYAFDWSTGEQGEDISGLTTGTYSVTINDKSGCELQQSFIVPDSIPYLIPNAFFPSGTEEINKNFKIYQAQNVHIESTQIFDRWGEKVYESQGDEYWDGSYKGKVLAPGVYLYKIVIDSPCGKETETGQVLLLR